MPQIRNMLEIIKEPQTLTANYENLGGKIKIVSYQKLAANLRITLNNSSDIRMRAFISFELDGTDFPITKEIVDFENTIKIEEKKLAEFENGSTMIEFAVPDGAVYLQLQIRAGTVGATPGVVEEAVAARCYNSNTLGTKSIERIKITDDVDDVDVEQMTDATHDLDNKKALVSASVIYARINGKILPILRDFSFPALLTINPNHYEIHEGCHYKFFSYNDDLDEGQTLEYILTTPDTLNWGHLIWKVDGALKTLVEIFEDTTHTTDVSQPVYNSNRNSSNVAGITIHTSNDDGVDGTRIDGASFGLATIGVVGGAGGGERGESEWVLKQNTKYLIKITSGSDDNNVSLKMSFYEHTNDN